MLENIINDYLVSICILMYLIGSIPFAIITSKVFALPDPRSYGSNNPGATNVYRSGHKFAAGITLIGDFLKGYIPAILLFNSNLLNYEVYALTYLILLGHIFPITLKFKGGKGVATYVGILFAINIYFGLIFIVSWLITFALSKFSSLSSLVASISIPIYLLILTQFDQVIFFAIMFVLIFFTHKENIKRLKNKEETKTKIY